MYQERRRQKQATKYCACHVRNVYCVVTYDPKLSSKEGKTSELQSVLPIVILRGTSGGSVTQEVEAGGSFEPRNSGTAWTSIVRDPDL
jgi:hypothetical protein